MIELQKIKYEFKYYVEVAYRGDIDLFKKYHVGVFDFQQAVNETMRMIYTTSLDVDMKKLAVTIDDKVIGYLCYFKNNLYSFGINIKYRTRDVLSEFWDNIKEVIGDSFICMLYPNNTRAIKWLQKSGMQIIEGVQENAVTLLYHNLN